MTTLVARHPVAAFLVLAFTLSWGGSLALQFAVAAGIPAPPPIVAVTGVAIAALVVSRINDGPRFAATWRTRFAPPWGERAVLVQTLAFVAGGCVIVGRADVDVPALLLAFACVGLGEEIGWRGFLVPRLLERHGLWTTHALVVAACGAWHLPKLVALPDAFLLPWLASLVLLALLLAFWVRDHARGYLVPAAVLHVATNAFVDAAATTGADVVAMWWRIDALLAALCIWNVREDRRRERARSEVR